MPQELKAKALSFGLDPTGCIEREELLATNAVTSACEWCEGEAMANDVLLNVLPVQTPLD